jgi:hypothetical protein
MHRNPRAFFNQASLALVLALGLLHACDYAHDKDSSKPDRHPEANDQGGGQLQDPSGVDPTYASLKTTLFDTCTGCHGAGNAKGGIDVSTYDGTTTGKTRDGEPLVVAGSPADSEIYKVVAAGRMPPRRTGVTVAPEVVAQLKAWIERGAPQ